MTLWLGIDGGGSTLRVIVIDDALRVVTQVHHDSAANPSTVGYETAQERVCAAIAEATGAVAGAIAGVGIGIAGAAAYHSSEWLRAVVGATLPDVPVAPSSDYEIALVGARGVRKGIMLLSGTGSVAFGIDTTGRWVQLGGWGYLLGDEGSGYWIGLQAMKSVVLEWDGLLSQPSQLPGRVREMLGLSSKEAVLHWTYGGASPAAKIAQVAPVVLELAESGDAYAREIVTRAAEHLAAMAEHLMGRLDVARDEIAFAGGLLSAENALSVALTARLRLAQRPQALYSPVFGAALLAKIVLS